MEADVAAEPAVFKREQAVTELMERLVDMPTEAMRVMRETVVNDRRRGEEYEQG